MGNKNNHSTMYTQLDGDNLPEFIREARESYEKLYTHYGTKRAFIETYDHPDSLECLIYMTIYYSEIVPNRRKAKKAFYKAYELALAERSLPIRVKIQILRERYNFN